MLYENLVGITPPYIDRHYFYSSRREWLDVLGKFEVEPGSGVDLEIVSTGDLKAVSGEPAAGSCILGVLAVLPSENKQQTRLVTGFAVSEEGVPDKNSLDFVKGAEEMGLEVVTVPVVGVNPTIHILIDPESGERSFIKETGIAPDIDFGAVDLSDAGHVIFDGRELLIGQTAQSLMALLESRAKKSVSLTLGSDEYLPRLSDNFQTLLRSGVICSVFGNLKEYAALIGVEPAAFDRQTILALIEEKRPRGSSFYITVGADGIFAMTDKGLHYQPTELGQFPSSVVSTSGAGDAAMGVIIGAISRGETVDEALKKANQHCAKVVRSELDIIPCDIW